MNTHTTHVAKQATDNQLIHAQKGSIRNNILNVIFLMVIVVVIPMAYYTGFIDKDWLNRIGIILNFCAGFMVSPELLIRSELLTKAEQNLEIFTLNVQTVTDAVQSRVGRLFKTFSQNKHDDIPSFFLSLVFSIFIFKGFQYAGMTFTYPFFTLMYILITPIVIFDLIREIIRGNRKKIRYHRYILAFIVFPLFFGIFVFAYTILFLILQTLRIISTTSQRTLDTLIGDGRLRAILIWWGIIFFSVGTAIQFIATF